MNGITFCLAGNTPALAYAEKFLTERGVDVTHVPSAEVTHLLLPVPSFDANGDIKGGGKLAQILKELPDSVTVLGGNLKNRIPKDRNTADLLQDELYLAENAAITADCTLGILIENLPVTLPGCPVLILGWGRIGQCLAQKLKALGTDVTVAARRSASRAMAAALGFSTILIENPGFTLRRYRVIVNTVPAPILSETDTAHCRPDCLKIDLASVKGIAGDDVIWARGLPSKDAPESSGRLIAETAIRLAFRKEIPL